jgi:hypothetical protein
MNGVVTFELVLLVGMGGCALGMLLIATSLNPQRNVVTRPLYRMWTFLPRVGSMTDEKWVLVNGVCMLLVGLFFLLSLVRLH